MLSHQNALHFTALPLQVLDRASVLVRPIDRSLAIRPRLVQLALHDRLQGQRLLAIRTRCAQLIPQHRRALVQLLDVAPQPICLVLVVGVGVAQLAVRLRERVVLDAQAVQTLFGVLEGFLQPFEVVFEHAFARE